MKSIILNRRQYLEFEKIGLGAFSPLKGFMNEADFSSVVQNMRLASGEPFPLPVVLDLDEDTADKIRSEDRVSLSFEGVNVGDLQIESFFTCDRSIVSQEIFGTDDNNHPGVDLFKKMGKIFVGGAVKLKERVSLDISEHELTPDETKAIFKERGWKTVVGFQTRNVPHRAHEYLQRVALETVDGLLIQPLIGRKKPGDYAPDAIMKGYRTLLEGFYPADRVVLGTLSTFMRYAGPREAIFHAIIRRNYGCTHFIVGRDHAGVGSYYGKYEAHELTRRFDGQLGIEVMRLHGPYYCAKCDGIVTEQTCPHHISAPEYVTEISGTDMRSMLVEGTNPKPHLMRPEIISSLRGIPLFVDEEEE